ncbi:YozQ family protein [Bacillus mexicanus]|uniref:YozQ family protein n=1 Tax=Bacillus TaxID=1386 RepID=UPI0013897727|nr:hypothetical protein BTW01_09885 [Bacillus sp. SKDU12]
MTQKNEADRPDDYKRFSSIGKEDDVQQNAKTESHNRSDTTDVAGRYFDPSDYKGTTQLEKGLAETHEQVSDDYFEGTIDQNLD